MNLINIAKEYFNLFELKDIDNLKKLFDKHISLQDWEINVEGLDNVIEKNIEIFTELDDFELTVNQIYLIDNIIFAEIDIITGDVKMSVLDKIEFNHKQIKGVTRQFGCMGAIDFETPKQSLTFIKRMRKSGYILEDGSENVSTAVFCLPLIFKEHNLFEEAIECIIKDM